MSVCVCAVSEEQRVRVEVVGGPEPPPLTGELPTARVEPDRQTVAQGTTIELRCQTQGQLPRQRRTPAVWRPLRQPLCLSVM